MMFRVMQVRGAALAAAHMRLAEGQGSGELADGKDRHLTPLDALKVAIENLSCFRAALLSGVRMAVIRPYQEAIRTFSRNMELPFRS